MAITSLGEIKKGLRATKDELFPSSAGRVSSTGQHIPDTTLFDAKNALPTQEGYTSFFGVSDTLGQTQLAADVQDIITYRTLHDSNIQLAFCSRGLYIRSLAGDGASTLVNVPAVGETVEHDIIDLPLGTGSWLSILATIPLDRTELWTYCLLGNLLYVFQKGMNFIGRVTSYAPNQVIFEHLSPTYILADRERHILTILSEDDSSGDDTLKTVRIETSTGLDYGLQQVAVDSASDVARAGDAWVNGSFLPASMTETLREEIAIDAAIAIDLPQATLDSIVANTLHNGSPAELTLTAAASPRSSLRFQGSTFRIDPLDIGIETSADVSIVYNVRIISGTADLALYSIREPVFPSEARAEITGGLTALEIRRTSAAGSVTHTVPFVFMSGEDYRIEEIYADSTGVLEVRINGAVVGTYSTHPIIRSSRFWIGDIADNTQYTMWDFAIHSGATLLASWPLDSGTPEEVLTPDPVPLRLYLRHGRWQNTKLHEFVSTLGNRVEVGLFSTFSADTVISYILTPMDLTLLSPIWGLSGNANYRTGIAAGGASITLTRGGIDAVFAYSFVVGTEYAIREEMNVATSEISLYINGALIGTLPSVALLDLSPLMTLLIYNGSPLSLIGVIKEFKLFESGTLLWHLPLADMVGYSTGDLATLGTLSATAYLAFDGYPFGGYWRERTDMGEVGTNYSGIRVQGFKRDFPSYLSYDSIAEFLPPSDDSNSLAAKLRTLYLQDNAIAAAVGAIATTVPASARLHYSVQWVLSLVDLLATVSATLTQDGTSVFSVSGQSNSTLPMGHIQGIMAGRSRLGAWDEDDTIYWSSGTNLVDFTPSASTGANQVTLISLKGKIVKCESFTHGFVVYGTGNAVVALFEKSATSMYTFTPVLESEGLIDPRHLTSFGDTHYYWSSLGVMILEPRSKKVSRAFQDITDWIKKYRYPIQVQALSSRFFSIYLQDRDRVFSVRDVREGAIPVLAHKAHPELTPLGFDVISPGSNLYGTYTRVLIYDRLLEKWGTCDVPCKRLASLIPYNQSGYQLSKDYQLLSSSLDNEQRALALISEDGHTRLCTAYPVDSYVVFGHFATSRDKTTKLIEVRTEYVDHPNAEVEIEASLSGSDIHSPSTVSHPQVALAQVQGFNLAAKWFNVLIKGHYHLKQIYIKGYTYGR